MAERQSNTSPHSVSSASSDTSQVSRFSAPSSNNAIPSLFSEAYGELSRQFYPRSPKLLSDDLQSELQALQRIHSVPDQLRLVCSALTQMLSVSFAAAAVFKPDFSICCAHFHSLQAHDAQRAAFLELLSQPAHHLQEFYDALSRQKKYRFQNAYCFEKHDIETTLGALCLPLPFVELISAPTPAAMPANKSRSLLDPVRQKSGFASTAFALRKIPLEILFMFYNSSARQKASGAYAVMLPLRKSDSSLFGTIFIGESLRDMAFSQEQVLELQQVIDGFVRSVGLTIEQALQASSSDSSSQVLTESSSSAALSTVADDAPAPPDVAPAPTADTPFISDSESGTTNVLELILTISQQISEQTTIEAKVQVFGYALVNLCGFSHCAVMLFQQSDELPQVQLYSASDAPPLRPFLSEKFALPRYLCDFIASSPTLQVEHIYCLSGTQISAIQSALENGIKVPDEWLSSALCRHQLERFFYDRDIGLFLFLLSGNTVLGYITLELDAPSDDVHRNTVFLQHQLRLASLLTDIIARDISRLQVQSEQKQYVIQNKTLHELLDLLFIISSRIQSAKTISEKFAIASEAIALDLGFTSASIVLYDRTGHITHAHIFVHPQADAEHEQIRFERRYRKGAPVPLRTLNIIFSSSFSAGYCYAFDGSQIRAAAYNPAMHLGTRLLQEYFSGNEHIGLMFPLLTENKELTGFIRLGKWMLPADEQLTAEFVERTKIIALFAERLSQDCSLIQLEAQREQEMAAKLRLSKTLTHLFESSSRISQATSLSQKLHQLTHTLVSAADFDFVGAVLYDSAGNVRYGSSAVSSSVSSQLQTLIQNAFRPGSKLRPEAYSAIFQNDSFRISPLKVYCCDLRQVKTLMNISSLSAPGTEHGGIIEIKDEASPTDGHYNFAQYFQLKQAHLPDADYYTLVVPLNVGAKTDLQISGFVSLGNFIDCKDLNEAMTRLTAIDLFISVVEADLTNFLLTENLAQESQDLFQKSLFIQRLLELDVQLAQPISVHDKIKMVCERSVEQSSFRYVLCALIDKNRQQLTDFYYMEHPELIAFSDDQPSKSIAPLIQSYSQGVAIYNPLFLELSMSEQNRVKSAGNAYCYDLRWLENEMRRRAHIPDPELELSPALSPEDAFAVFCGHIEREDHLINFIIPLVGSQGKLFGFLSLGRMLSRVKKSVQEVLDDVRLIELIASSLATHLENMELNMSLTASEAKFRNIVENVEYGFIIFDQNGKIEYANAALKRLLNRGNDLLIGYSLEDIAHRSSVEAVRRQLRLLFSGGVPSEEDILLVTSTGDIIPFKVSAEPQLILRASGEVSITGAFAVLVDMRKQLELERQRKELETIRNNFFAMIVHDMKVPLSAIFGYSEILKQEDLASMPLDKLRNIMDQIYLSSSNITRLVQEILDFSKYESRMVKLDLTKSSLELCIDLVLEQNHFDLQAKGITVKKFIAPEDFLFYFDFDKVARVINNLVSNAIKFSYRNSQIEVRLEKVLEHFAPFARVMVIDYGEGIPSDEVEFIFDAYRQANSKHGSRGTGLGLSIAKQIVELHGGKIWAESQLGKGTTVSFTLPMHNHLPEKFLH
jgi:PAS domain S-box-containing protein